MVKLLLGELKPASGKITLHPLMRIGYFSQDSVSELTRMAVKEPKLTALRYFAQEMEKERGSIDEGEIRACLASFGLQGKTASETPVALLSGGQKVRTTATGFERLQVTKLLETGTTCVFTHRVETTAHAVSLSVTEVYCATTDHPVRYSVFSMKLPHTSTRRLCKRWERLSGRTKGHWCWSPTTGE